MRFTAVRVSLVLVCVLGLIGLTACGGGGSSSSGGGGGGGGTPTLNSISISPVGPAVAPNGSVTLTATGTYSDNSTKDLTSSATWSADNSVVSVSAGTVTAGASPGVATVTATSGSVSASTAVNVTSGTFGKGSLPSGTSYAFSLTSMGGSGLTVIVGSFTVDGNGNITGGEADINAAGLVTQQASVASGGTYTVWPDGRGEATISVQGVSSHFAFVITATDGSGHATKGKMIAFDSNKSYGTFELQTASADLSGAYVFALNGLDSSGKNMAEIGGFNTAGSGSADVNDNGTIDGGSTIPPSAPALSTVTVSTVGTGNRGKATLGSASFAFYSIDATKAYLVQIDSSSVLSGVAEKQTAIQPLSPENPTAPCDSTVGGTEATCNYGFLLSRAVTTQSGPFERAGQFNFCPCTTAGGINHAREDDQDGSTWTMISGTRPFDSMGRGVINYNVANTLTSSSPRSVIAWAISRTPTNTISTSASHMYVMNTDDATPGVGSADYLDVEANSMPAAGTYAFSAVELGATNLLELGQTTINASGNVSGIAYVNNKGTLSTVAVSGTYSPSTDTSNGGDGRGQIKPFNSVNSSMTAYNVGSTGFILVDTSGTTPGISGRMEPQQ